MIPVIVHASTSWVLASGSWPHAYPKPNSHAKVYPYVIASFRSVRARLGNPALLLEVIYFLRGSRALIGNPVLRQDVLIAISGPCCPSDEYMSTFIPVSA